jgi:protocatechuate 3,4-dioxygenase, alpha subunit
LRTPSQTVGPYYAIGLCRRTDSELVAGGIPVNGQLFDGQDEPISDGMVELWDGEHWGRSGTDHDGRFSLTVAKPAPRDGGAPRLDVLVFARGLLRHQWTRLYFPDEAEANAADWVLAALSPAERRTLVAEEGDGELRFDIRMQGERETVFFAA